MTHRRSCITLSALAVALSALFVAPASRALTIEYTDITPGGMAPVQLAAFTAAAGLWQSRLSDPVTVYVTIGFQTLPGGVLGSADAATAVHSYATVRSALLADSKSGLDVSATSHLQAGNSLAFQATNLDLSSRLDNDTNACPTSGPSVPCAYNNQNLVVTTANAKALGLGANTSPTRPDGTIVFNTLYANLFDFTRDDGIVGFQYDFVAVAAHEIGHALGFVSGVDDVDTCAPLAAGRCNGLPDIRLDNLYGLESRATYSVLDLYRYSAPGVLDFRVGGSPYFSVDGGATSIELFSTGQHNGDNWQASHFLPATLHLMAPSAPQGYAADPDAADVGALDVIGWDDVSAVPEPASALLMGLGLAGSAALRRRRAAAGWQAPFRAR